MLWSFRNQSFWNYLRDRIIGNRVSKTYIQTNSKWTRLVGKKRDNSLWFEALKHTYIIKWRINGKPLSNKKELSKFDQYPTKKA